MTNYNERLDEILALLNAQMPQPKTINEAKARVAMCHKAKQSLTSLMKELVAEASNKMSEEEPKKEIFYEPDDIDDLVVWTFPCTDCGEVGCPYMYGEDRKELEERLRTLIKEHREAYVSEFEQNLLKALEE